MTLTVGLSSLALDDLREQTEDKAAAFLAAHWTGIEQTLAANYERLPWNGRGLKRYAATLPGGALGIVLDAYLWPAAFGPGPDVMVVAIELVEF